ncbi:hypothetical protein RHCRD62_40058 [Rhodococcus sp. RD6.2]|nr:hypothetical protein RHCRD62_40058 [Rhodococcus sp. RD6.2]
MSRPPVPVRWRQAIVTYCCVFPGSLVLSVTLSPMLGNWPKPASVALTSVVLVRECERINGGIRARDLRRRQRRSAGRCLRRPRTSWPGGRKESGAQDDRRRPRCKIPMDAVHQQRARTLRTIRVPRAGSNRACAARVPVT